MTKSLTHPSKQTNHAATPDDDTNGFEVGQVHLFDAVSGNLVKTFNEPTPTPDHTGGDNFGKSVAIDGNKVVVGALWDDTNGFRVGQAYLFDAVSGNLVQRPKSFDPGSRLVPILWKWYYVCPDRSGRTWNRPFVMREVKRGCIAEQGWSFWRRVASQSQRLPASLVLRDHGFASGSGGLIRIVSQDLRTCRVLGDP